MPKTPDSSCQHRVGSTYFESDIVLLNIGFDYYKSKLINHLFVGIIFIESQEMINVDY